MSPHPEEAAKTRPRRIVVCGGGASGVALINALRRQAVQPVHVTLVDSRVPPGVGLAYSTQSPSHLLNVPAGRMSADALDPSAFIDWLNKTQSHRTWDAKEFVQRRLYGAYLRDILHVAATDTASPVRTDIRIATVTAVARHHSSWRITFANGEGLDADAVVVATGNEPPRPQFKVASNVDRARIVQDPWDAAAMARIPNEADVVLLGSGLTAVDVAVELLDAGHSGRIRMISRNGLLPRKHAPSLVASSWLFPPYPNNIVALLRQVRAEAERIPGTDAWRTAIDALRPNLPAIWAALTDEDKVRFLRHVRSFWEVHRHRMAPEIASRIEGATMRGQLSVEKGRLSEIAAAPAGHLILKLKPRGRTQAVVHAHTLVNCTGPDYNPRTSHNPLIVSLLSQGLARPDPLHLGLDTDAEDRVIAADGRPQRGLYAIGPVARGRLWEVTAMPEIRQQAAALSRRLTLPDLEHEVVYAI